MSRKYKFRNPEAVYFVTFATVNQMYMQFSTSKTVTDCLNKKHKLRFAKLALRGENELNGSVFEPLHDKTYFSNFSIAYNTIEWENGAD